MFILSTSVLILVAFCISSEDVTSAAETEGSVFNKTTPTPERTIQVPRKAASSGVKDFDAKISSPERTRQDPPREVSSNAEIFDETTSAPERTFQNPRTVASFDDEVFDETTSAPEQIPQDPCRAASSDDEVFDESTAPEKTFQDSCTVASSDAEIESPIFDQNTSIPERTLQAPNKVALSDLKFDFEDLPKDEVSIMDDDVPDPVKIFVYRFSRGITSDSKLKNAYTIRALPEDEIKSIINDVILKDSKIIDTNDVDFYANFISEGMKLHLEDANTSITSETLIQYNGYIVGKYMFIKELLTSENAAEYAQMYLDEIRDNIYSGDFSPESDVKAQVKSFINFFRFLGLYKRENIPDFLLYIAGEYTDYLDRE